jgi:tetratricopeptide (TPR) repeat protein
MKTRSTILFALFFAFLAFSVSAQIPEVKTQLSATEQPVELVELDAEVRIIGFIAQTTMKMKFLNPNSRVLEGELYFPLPETAVLTGYGLDVNGDMVDGVAVEKQKGREVFETEVRKGVDPGLLEKVKGNNFKTRVYPLNPGDVRTVKVVYTTEASYRDGEITYRLPLELSKEIKKISFRINVLKVDSKPSIEIKGLKDRSFKKVDTGWFSELSGSGRDFSSEIKVDIPFDKELVIVEKADDGKHYFMVQGVKMLSASSRRSKSITRIAVCFDASDSGKKRDQKAELEFLKKFVASDLVNLPVEVCWIPFRNKPGEQENFSLQPDAISQIEELVNKTVFDGGTSFDGLAEEIGNQPDCILLFSDGIGTFGKTSVPEFSAPVMAISSSQGSDYNFLQAVAERSGGKFLNLKNLNAAEAVRECSSGFRGIVNKSYDSNLFEVLPEGKQEISDKYAIFGIVEGSGGELKIDFGTNAAAVVSSKSFSIKTKDALNANFVRQLWAGKKIAELLTAKDQNRREIVKLSKKFGIVTDFTSLIVLERLEQYVEHEIIPPASKSEWRKRYFEIIEKQDLALKSEQKKNLSNVLSMWENRLEWWNTDFSKVDTSRIKKSDFPDYGRGDTGSNYLDSAPESFADGSSIPMERSRVRPSRSIQNEVDSFDSAAEPSLQLKKAKSEAKETISRVVNPGVAIKAWKPDAKYAQKISDANDKFGEYLNQKEEFGNAPSFYLDCADIFKEAGNAELAIQVLSNISELELENPALLRILAHRLAQLEELEISAGIFAEVLEMRKEEPQSYRDLALVLGRLQKYQRAINLLYQVVLKTWDNRFPEIEVIALEEMNNLIVKAKEAGITEFNVDERLIKPIDVDLRIVMTWDADMTDMDLWVIEPTGERAYYKNPKTAIGGLVSRDFTRGYGPEEYMIRKARTGTYEIKTNFYGSSSQKIAGAVTLQVDVFTNYGRADEKRRSVTLRLKDKKETFTVADVEF